jgi:hypothetical protein
LLGGVLLVGMERAPIPCSVCKFVQSYQTVENTHAPMRLWERLVYSFALTKQREAERKSAHGTA